jgi:diacylglycerol kinase (ATP)
VGAFDEQLDIATKLKVARGTSLVIVSTKAGSMTPVAEAKIRKAFQESLVVEFDPDMDIEKLVAPSAKVVVAGGDGTIEWVVRRLVETKHPLGIISLGTFNNFAKSLRLPKTVDAAIRVIKQGKPTPITLGRVNGHVFLEAAAIGLFGEAIGAGEAAKDRAFGDFAQAARRVFEARPFKYELTEDIRGYGTAMSLVFSNTSSIGSQLPVGDNTPEDPYLELSLHSGWGRGEIVKRALARAIPSRVGYRGIGQLFKFRRVEVKTTPSVSVYADSSKVSRTPATITAELSALKVILPR